MEEILKMAESLGIPGLPDTPASRSAQYEDAQKASKRKFDDLDRLWSGSDNDAKMARAFIGGLEQILGAIVNESQGSVSKILEGALQPMMQPTMDLMDALRDIGVTRTMAQGLPIPGTPEWNRPGPTGSEQGAA
jgi:hypothetical protein